MTLSLAGGLHPACLRPMERFTWMWTNFILFYPRMTVQFIFIPDIMAATHIDGKKPHLICQPFSGTQMKMKEREIITKRSNQNKRQRIFIVSASNRNQYLYIYMGL
mmetsp:Transcript_13341/g.25039  ORF Transcript_13341/g.25039 Transcript_13341/m.25039 type:complete len:106 (+) Transcript_13341:1783-2100(+)